VLLHGGERRKIGVGEGKKFHPQGTLNADRRPGLHFRGTRKRLIKGRAALKTKTSRRGKAKVMRKNWKESMRVTLPDDAPDDGKEGLCRQEIRYSSGEQSLRCEGHAPLRVRFQYL